MSRGRPRALRLHWLGMLLLGLLALLLLTFCLSLAQETKETETQKPWTGKLADGRMITKADLDQILQAHALWLKSKEKEGQRADLSKANLRGAILGKVDLEKASLSGIDLSQVYLMDANLSGADLSYANLSGAELSYANLSGVRLSNANLSKADFLQANLRDAFFGGANLSKAKLTLTDLSRANLNEADLSQATLWETNLSLAKVNFANLSQARLTHANLSGASLISANLSQAELIMVDLNVAGLGGGALNGAVFEPKPGTIPDAYKLIGIEGLATITYKRSPHGLIELREAFKKAGLREEERQVTFALNHNRRLKSGKLESLFHLVCFEWTCQYGMNPGRPLEILGLGLFLFTLPYLLALRSRDRETGIWLVLPPDRILGGGKDRPYKLTTYRPFRPLPMDSTRFGERILRRWRVVRLAFYFSLLSAFNLGWRELNVGSWISRLQKHEYTLRATGWPRTVAGLQSLLSVYLLALWVLTYFGRPFD